MSLSVSARAYAAPVVVPQADSPNPPATEGPGSPTPTAPTPTTPTIPGAGEDTFTDAQGRLWRRTFNASTGDVELRHHSEAQSADGARRATLDILIAIHADGTTTRTVDQNLSVNDGSFRKQKTTTHFDTQGRVTGETQVTQAKQVAATGTIELTERANSTYTNGVETLRKSEAVRTDSGADAAGNTTSATQKTIATWDAAGAPITEATVPVIDFTEDATMTDPKGGLVKGHKRELMTHRHASGPLNSLSWDPMTLIVRWHGKGDDFIERHIQYSLDSRGGITGRPKVTKEVDNRELHKRMLDKARIYGSFSGSWAWFASSLLRNTSLRGPARGLMWAGVGLNAAGTVGHGYALANRYNGASYGDLYMSVWDTAMVGLAASLTRRRSTAADPSVSLVRGVQHLNAGRVIVGTGNDMLNGGVGELPGGTPGAGSFRMGMVPAVSDGAGDIDIALTTPSFAPMLAS